MRCSSTTSPLRASAARRTLIAEPVATAARPAAVRLRRSIVAVGGRERAGRSHEAQDAGAMSVPGTASVRARLEQRRARVFVEGRGTTRAAGGGGMPHSPRRTCMPAPADGSGRRAWSGPKPTELRSTTASRVRREAPPAHLVGQQVEVVEAQVVGERELTPPQGGGEVGRTRAGRVRSSTPGRCRALASVSRSRASRPSRARPPRRARVRSGSLGTPHVGGTSLIE